MARAVLPQSNCIIVMCHSVRQLLALHIIILILTQELIESFGVKIMFDKRLHLELKYNFLLLCILCGENSKNLA